MCSGENVKKPNRSTADYMPLWFQLQPDFYRLLGRLAQHTRRKAPDVLTESPKLFQRLNAIADEVGISRVQCLKTAARLIRSRKRAKKKRAGKPLVAYRWEKVPPEKRSEIARELAWKRWAKR